MNVAAFSEKRQEQKCLIFNENNNNMSCIHLEKKHKHATCFCGSKTVKFQPNW